MTKVKKLRLLEPANKEIQTEMSRDNIIQYFEDYVRSYDFNDERIALKYKHSYMVAQICEEIATDIGLGEYDIYVSWVIGLLHDIGRFEQLTNYNTYDDNYDVAVDHAKLGERILRDHDGLRECFSKEYYDLILKAVYCHNVYELNEDMYEKELLFCNIIRDADKLDIFRVIAVENYEHTIGFSYNELIASQISDIVINELKKKIVVSKAYRMTPADQIIGVISLYYGLYFTISKELMIKQGYIFSLMNIEYTIDSTMLEFEKIKIELMNEKQY